MQTINAESFASLDAVPMCISVVSYALPSRNLWANATYLRCASASLADFQALVCSITSLQAVLLPPRCERSCGSSSTVTSRKGSICTCCRVGQWCSSGCPCLACTCWPAWLHANDAGAGSDGDTVGFRPSAH